MNNLKDIHNTHDWHQSSLLLFYQDFNEQFEGYTQPMAYAEMTETGCFIRISMNNLKDIHNVCLCTLHPIVVVLSGFQWTIWRIYTTTRRLSLWPSALFYQDFNEQFEGYTQRWMVAKSLTASCFIRISMNNLKDIHNHIHTLPWQGRVVLSGFQWTIWRIYTTISPQYKSSTRLFYQDFNEQFEGYTQLCRIARWLAHCCFIRISMNNLKDIHNSK